MPGDLSLGRKPLGYLLKLYSGLKNVYSTLGKTNRESVRRAEALVDATHRSGIGRRFVALGIGIAWPKSAVVSPFYADLCSYASQVHSVREIS